MVTVTRQWLWFALLMLMVLPGVAGQAKTPDIPETERVQANPRVQVLDSAAHRAFIIVPLVCGFFIDLVNAFIINFFVGL